MTRVDRGRSVLRDIVKVRIAASVARRSPRSPRGFTPSPGVTLTGTSVTEWFALAQRQRYSAAPRQLVGRRRSCLAVPLAPLVASEVLLARCLRDVTSPDFVLP